MDPSSDVSQESGPDGPSRGVPRHAVRWTELAAIFVAVPGALAWMKLQGGVQVPVIPTLVGLALFMGVALWRDPGFRAADLRPGLAERADRRRVALRFLAGATALTALVATLLPERFLELPRERPLLWAMVMVGYPVLSVIPQELLYRTFFFHRYRRLLGASTWLASALVFGWAHLLFGNWIAVALTIIGGGLFADTYRRTGSLGLASLEHALYGQLVFTIGLGRYFYGGTVQAIGGA